MINFDLPAEAAKDLVDLAKQVARLTTPEPAEFTLSFADICDLSDTDLAAKLPQDLKGKTKSIYVFYLVDGATKDSVAAAYTEQKSAKDGRAYAKFLGGKDTCLYVGSCFIVPTLSRLKQHFGLSAAGTYAMQIKHWPKGIQGGVKISIYSYYDQEISQKALQALEDCLHSELGPILGKKGGK